jgi:uncharacterized protein
VYDEGGGAVTNLKIDLANIAGTPGARGRYAISERLAPIEGISSKGPVVGEITAENTGPLLLVRGRLRAVLVLSCVRCLGEAEQLVEVDVEEEFASEYTSPDVDTIDRDEPEASAISEYMLDVSELARQQVALGVPMGFVCSPDCRGLCPSCGRNLNEGACECRLQGMDSRWGKLAELLDDAAGETDV